MCGIAGVVALSPGARVPDTETLSRIAGALRHRGPEEFGAYRDEACGFAHARLSIVDLSSGQQPMCNEDATLWICFNGEIFNYVELAEELRKLGHTFKTRCDTEVLLHAYEAWGVGAFDRFNGQWAVALWDRRRKRLVLSRDRVGILPLYYAQDQGRLVFASEVKGLFAAAPSMTRALDPVGLSETFTFWSTVPPQTVYQGIFEVEPGHVRTYEGGQVSDVSYWQPRYPEMGQGAFQGTVQEAADAVREALEKATRLRMLRADVPVGSYLSGGLDSSLVATLGRAALGDRFHTFSLRFSETEFDETSYQRRMVERLGSEHHEVLVTPADIAHVFPDVVRHTERPILRTAPAPLFLLSKRVRETGIKVVLTGEGADEMFGGYDLFKEGRVRRFWARQPHSTARPRLLERLYPYLARSPVSQRAVSQQFFGRQLAKWRDPGFAHETRWHTTRALQRLFTESQRHAAAAVDVTRRLVESLPGEFSRWGFLAQDQYLEIRTLLAGYLMSSQGDRMLMANSVEGRFPFLDSEVVALAQALPASYKLRGLDEKHVLKRAARNLVPEEILRRTKQPYRAPDAQCFITPDAPGWIDEALSEPALLNVGVFDPRAVQQLRAKLGAGKGVPSNSDNMALVGVLSTQLVHAQFIQATPPAPAVPFKTLHTFSEE